MLIGRFTRCQGEICSICRVFLICRIIRRPRRPETPIGAARSCFSRIRNSGPPSPHVLGLEWVDSSLWSSCMTHRRRWTSRSLALVVAILLAGMILREATPLHAQKLPPVGEVFLRLEAEGPTSPITAIAFSPDGNSLFAAGYD